MDLYKTTIEKQEIFIVAENYYLAELKVKDYIDNLIIERENLMKEGCTPKLNYIKLSELKITHVRNKLLI